ncbi:hypothetical protein ACIP2Y_20570 [Streptomyces sviceus]|uniref:hypothetical protein n=1 Tax=Streptomyces sviceus TaxID=285530 RepID=UPI0037F12340
MSTVHETTVDLTTVVRDLEKLAAELRAPRLRRIPPEISAACDALSCAAVLLRTRQHVPGGDAMRGELLFDAIALARSTVEATKVACRERAGARVGGSGA